MQGKIAHRRWAACVVALCLLETSASFRASWQQPHAAPPALRIARPRAYCDRAATRLLNSSGRPAGPRLLNSSGRTRVQAERQQNADSAGKEKPDVRPSTVTPQLELEQLMDVGMRFAGLAALIDGLKRSGFSTQVRRGSVVIARYDVPALRIVESQSYVVTDIYLQGPGESTTVERVPLESLDDARPPGTEQHVLYVKLFSSNYHTEPVICTPQEIGLVTLRDEVFDALRVATPILGFWVSLCIFFWSYGSITSPPALPPAAPAPVTSAAARGEEDQDEGRPDCTSLALSITDTRRCLEP